MKKALSLGLASLFISIVPALAATNFSDVPQTHENYVSIVELSEEGILKGYEDGSFKPNKVVNRAEALKVILEGANAIVPNDQTETGFSDVAAEQWFAKYVALGRDLGIVKGNPDGTFKPSQEVKRVEFIKMLLEVNKFKSEKWANQKYYDDIEEGSWYEPYMNYAGKAGLIQPNKANQLEPEKVVTRGEVAEILYLMRLILNGKNTQFLISQAETQMAQIEVYVAAKQVGLAKRSSELGYDLTQQALRNMPENNVVLGAAKIAVAYDLLIDAYIAGLTDNKELAGKLAEQSKTKATEAWEANNETQPIARHIKNRAEEILSQL